MSETWTQRMNKALTHLGETDEQEAQLRSLVEKNKKKMEATFKIVASANLGTVIEKEARAYEHENYKTVSAAYFLSLTEHGKLKNERATDSITIDVWRSLNAARNKGQIV